MREHASLGLAERARVDRDGCVSQFFLIAVGSAILAVRARGPLPRRSWWWLTVGLGLDSGMKEF